MGRVGNVTTGGEGGGWSQEKVRERTFEICSPCRPLDDPFDDPADVTPRVSGDGPGRRPSVCKPRRVD